MSNKGKSRSRKARMNFLKANDRLAARKARQLQQQRPKPGKAANYDRAAYDGNSTKEES